MKIKVIDILNKIARGEEPPTEIMYESKCYKYEQEEKDYYCFSFDEYLFDSYVITDILNNEVEILEITIHNKEDLRTSKRRIEKLDFDRNDITYCDGNLRTDEDMVDIIIEIKNKINEIIDFIQE